MTDYSLTFRELNEANVRRCEESYHPVADWTPSDWAMATAGELGELFNLLKRQRRGEDISIVAIADEFADTVIYLDLLAERVGVDLGEAVRAKFNFTSARMDSEVRL